MPIFKKDEQLPQQPVIVMIYGDPGTSKTSLANTCEKPLILDFDRGFKRSYGRPDALIISNGWSEIESLIADGSLLGYKTIVIDTVKSCLDDFIMPDVVEKDYKLKTNKLKAFGELGERFKLFINTLRLMGCDIFIIAHSKSQEDGDSVRKIADITGSSSSLVLRIADQVGYLKMLNGKRVLSFNPTDLYVGKNVAQLPDITLPSQTDASWDGFAGREIIDKVKTSLSTMSEDQRKALSFIEEWRNSIDAVTPSEDVSKFAGELGETMKGISDIKEEHLKKQIRVYFSAHLKKIGWKWDGERKSFVAIENKPQEPSNTDVPAIEVKDDLFAG